MSVVVVILKMMEQLEFMRGFNFVNEPILIHKRFVFNN